MVREFDSWDLMQDAARDGRWMRNEEREGRGKGVSGIEMGWGRLRVG